MLTRTCKRCSGILEQRRYSECRPCGARYSTASPQGRGLHRTATGHDDFKSLAEWPHQSSIKAVECRMLAA